LKSSRFKFSNFSNALTARGHPTVNGKKWVCSAPSPAPGLLGTTKVYSGMGADIVNEALRSKCLEQSFDRSSSKERLRKRAKDLYCGRIQEHSLEQCNLAGVIDRMLRCALEEPVESVVPTGYNVLEPLVSA
jgi:hypothetical protein